MAGKQKLPYKVGAVGVCFPQKFSQATLDKTKQL
jgi:hypothetical protein